MNSYKYSAAVRSEKKLPDPGNIMDELAQHALENPSMEQAMLQLRRHGVKENFGESLDGLDQLASRLRELRRQLQERYTFEPLLEELSRRIQSLVHRELEALQKSLATNQKKLNDRTQSFLGKMNSIVKKIEKMRADQREFTPQKFTRLENRFEEMFLEKHELQTALNALRKDQARRLASLQQVPQSPGQALRKLEGYEAIDPSAGEALASLTALTEEIGAIERAQAQSGFSGNEPIGLDEAVELVKRLLGMQRLENKLRKGTLSPADESLLAETLGSDAVDCLGAIGQLEGELLRTGYLETGRDGVKLSPRAIRRIGSKALSNVFSRLGKGHLGGHRTALKGIGQPDTATTRKYDFGDAFNIDLGKTLMNAVMRDPGRLPLDISPSDFEAYGERRTTDCSNALMIDLSYTMSQNGKLQAAKKVGFALNSLIQTRFPRDTLHIVGFATYARELTPEELLHISLNLGNPFTNMQDGFRLAEKLISRDRARNRQIMLITDGEPTAFCRDGDLLVDYPPSPEIFQETMKEVVRLTRRRIVINTFMLDNQPLLVKFVEEMTVANKGRAFFSSPQKLGEYLLIDYLARRRRLVN